MRKPELVSGAARRNRHLAKAKQLDQRRAAGLRNALAAGVRRLLGGVFRSDGRSVLRDAATGTVVRRMVAGNSGVVGTYRFLFSRDYVAELEAAGRAYVALGFADRADFLLVPWPVFRTHVASLGGAPETGYLAVILRATPDGSVGPFGEYACSRQA